jgi:endonuclease/exonuclease/phosphatase family metal-dependent hydrolase
MIQLLLAILWMFASPSTQSAANDLRVMSFNLRYSTANDGEDSWESRREMLIETIRRDHPDLLGTQECLAEQADYLREQLPYMSVIAVHRDDGKRKGEASAILFRMDRFELLASGTFWLSPTPEKIGSKGWDADCTRIVTWAKLRDKASGKNVAWLNTHWDHIGKQARLESAGMMRRWIDANAAEMPVIITGDFNTHLDAPPYARLFDAKEWTRPLIDTYAKLHGPNNNGGGTYHGFKGKGAGARIDWIICSQEFEPIDSGIDTFNVDGRFPSDHFPVTAVLRFKAQ